MSEGRDLYSGAYALVKNSKKGPKPIKQKPISYLEDMIVNDVLTVTFRPVLKGTPSTVHVSIVHEKGKEGIEVFDTPGKNQLRGQIEEYERKVV